MVAQVAGLKIDFAQMIISEIHERSFKTSTTYPFSVSYLPLVQGLQSAYLSL